MADPHEQFRLSPEFAKAVDDLHATLVDAAVACHLALLAEVARLQLEADAERQADYAREMRERANG